MYQHIYMKYTLYILHVPRSNNTIYIFYNPMCNLSEIKEFYMILHKS